jgi:uncharacterized protein DUF6766
MAEPSEQRSPKRFFYENGLSLFFLFIFLAALIAQALVGHAAYNEEQSIHGQSTISLWSYITSSSFGNAVMENWQSEYLQFTLFMLATVWLIQRGSPESKPEGDEGTESERRQGIGGWAPPEAPRWARARGIRTWMYSNSLLIVMALIFIGSWFAQSVTGWTEFNSEQQTHGEQAVSWLSYIGSSHFWEATLQNWQSEFLAVGSFVVLAIYLRQRGSPESKPVGAPHEATGVEG